MEVRIGVIIFIICATLIGWAMSLPAPGPIP